MKIKVAILFIIIIFIVPIFSVKTVCADSLSDTINEQIENIDLSELENFFNNITNLPENINFHDCIFAMISGNFNINFDSLSNYLLSTFFSGIKRCLPTFLSIIAIALFCGLIQKIKSSFIENEIANLITIVCLLSIILIITSEIISIWENAKNTIKNIANLTEIMSPIILTLMVASGGNVSASVYNPSVTFLSNGVINIFLSLIMPLVGLMIIFSVINEFSSTAKLEKFNEVCATIIKWVIGIVVSVFTIFLSVQGLTSATFDGISIKATKYAISNSIPIIGGFIKDGFDLIVAGSILIKSVVGIIGVFALFYTIISPVLYIVFFSILLKLTCAIISPITDSKITNFLSATSKNITYISATLIAVGFMFFITILLITISATAFF